MSRHTTSPSRRLPRHHLAPLAAAVALLSAALGAQAQIISAGPPSVIGPTPSQSSSGPITANGGANLVLGTLDPVTTNNSNNSIGSSAHGNEHQLAPGATEALSITSQAGAVNPVVAATQLVTGAVTANTTNSTIGIDTTGAVNALANAGSRIGATANVSGNEVSSQATGNSDVATMAISAPTLVLATPAIAGSAQTAASNISANTAVRLLGASIQPRSGSWTDLTINVSGNAADTNATANQSKAGINVTAPADLTISASGALISGATQQQAGTTRAISTVDTLGTLIQGTLISPSPSDSSFNTSGNQATASAQGNQQSNQIAVAAGSVQLDGTLPAFANTIQTASGSTQAQSVVGTLGVSNGSTNSSGNQYIVNGNTAGSSASGNAGSTGVSVLADSNISGPAAMGPEAIVTVGNTQAFAGTGVSALTKITLLGSSMAPSPLGNSSGDTQTISGNKVYASAQGSDATNTATLQASSGIDNTGAAMTNLQNHVSGNVSATTEVTALGSRALFSQDGSQTVTGNSLQATAQSTRASNAVSITGGALDFTPAAIVNTQTHTAGNTSATLDVAQLGSVRTTLGPLPINTFTRDQQTVSGNTLTAVASSQTASNQAAISGSSLDNAGALIANTQTHVSGNVSATVANLNQVSPAPAPSPIMTMVGVGALSLSGGQSVVSGNNASADANINLAANSAALKSDTSMNGAGSGAILGNVQDAQGGNASSLVQVDFGVSGLRSGGHEAIVSDNSASASASQNQAINAISLKAGTNLVAPTLQLGSDQKAAGNTSATVTTNLLTGTGAGNSGATTVSDNQASTSARANVANNVLALDSVTASGGLAGVLSNVQANGGLVNANTTMTIGVQGALDTGAVTVSGNAVDALGAGNAALNSINAAAGTAFNGNSANLLNTQTNNGAITATAALNAPAGQPMVSGGASGSNLLNNTVTATAYGNNAVNQINIVALPGQLAASTNLTSTQINTGAVTATAGGNISSGGVSTGNNISGNRISAVAVGNNSVSSMTLGVK